MTTDASAIVRASFEAYVNKDRSALDWFEAKRSTRVSDVAYPGEECGRAEEIEARVGRTCYRRE